MLIYIYTNVNLVLIKNVYKNLFNSSTRYTRFFNDFCRSSLKIADNIKRCIAYKYINFRNEHVCINALVMLF